MTELPMPAELHEELIAWLLAGDAAIRWQTMRDLLDAPAGTWQAEQQHTQTSGWGAQLLALQAPDGRWGGGIYSPKWVSTTYTLLTLADIGLPQACAAAQKGTRLLLDEMLGPADDPRFTLRLAQCDRCIVGMILRLAVCFTPVDERIEPLVGNLLAEMMPDGAWNCRRQRRPRPVHSSFHTTFNVLEGLREYIERGDGPLRPAALAAAVSAAEASALEFMLQHRLYRSDKTGEVINEKFTRFSFPTRWYYDVLRGLSYFARANAPRDARLEDALALLARRQRQDGRWPVQNKHPGRVHFDMEKTGGPSRWNTLRALRVLRWWHS